MCNFFNTKHYQSRCWSWWSNLDRFQYQFQPTNFMNSVVSRPCEAQPIIMSKHHYRAELQTAKQTPTTSKILIEVTYGDFPCHLKENRDKLVLINRLWKCKKDKRFRIAANSFTKIDQPDGFPPLRRSRRENSSHSRNQSDCRICWIPSTHMRKN